MADWPTQGDVEAWLSGQSISVATFADRLPFAFEAALEVTKDAVEPTFMPEDESVTSRLRFAVLVLAHRLLTRSDSPSGIIGFAEFAVRVSKEDPDYQMLIHRYQRPPFI